MPHHDVEEENGRRCAYQALQPAPTSSAATESTKRAHYRVAHWMTTMTGDFTSLCLNPKRSDDDTDNDH